MTDTAREHIRALIERIIEIEPAHATKSRAPCDDCAAMIRAPKGNPDD